jgi:hypothetical protein
MTVPAMEEETIIQALQSKLKEDMETPENVHFNDGIITAIEEVKKQYLLQKLKNTPERSYCLVGCSGILAREVRP